MYLLNYTFAYRTFVWSSEAKSQAAVHSDYSYSPAVYNNFPWPDPTDAQKAKIEQTAQAILDARALYPDSSLADLYDELTMPPELRKAHQNNDRAVMQALRLQRKNHHREFLRGRTDETLPAEGRRTGRQKEKLKSLHQKSRRRKSPALFAPVYTCTVCSPQSMQRGRTFGDPHAAR